MATIHLHRTTPLTPEQYIAGLTDFGPGRSKLFGNSADEYEDAFWPREAVVEQETDCFRCAVADGATETSFSALWANMLVRQWGEGTPGLSAFGKALPRLRSLWHREVAAKPLPWYAEEKVRSGAFSSLLGVTLLRAGRLVTVLPDWQRDAFPLHAIVPAQRHLPLRVRRLLDDLVLQFAQIEDDNTGPPPIS